MNVLAIQRRRLGDILMTTPALRALRARFPQARVAYVCDRALAGLVESGGLVDEVLAVEPDAGARARLRLVRELRRRALDLALDFEGSPFSAFIAAASGARRRIGFGSGPAALAYTDRVRPEPEAFVAAENLALLAPLGIDARGAGARPALPVTPEAREWARRSFEAAGIPPAELVVTLAPGARSAEHCWPVERYAALLDRLAADFAFSVIVFPWSWDRVLGGELARLTHVPLLQLDTLPSLPQVAALLDRADLHVGNENATTHMAAALGTATLTLYAPGMRRRWGTPGDPLQVGLEPRVSPGPGQVPEAGLAGIGVDEAHAAARALETYLPRLADARRRRAPAPAPREGVPASPPGTFPGTASQAARPHRPRHSASPPRGQAARSGGA